MVLGMFWLLRSCHLLVIQGGRVILVGVFRFVGPISVFPQKSHISPSHWVLNHPRLQQALQ